MKFERTPQQVKEFVLINHHLMTSKELAEELDQSVNNIGIICRKLGVKPVTELERKQDYIKVNSHLTAEEIGNHLGSSPYYVKDVAKQMGIELKTEEDKRLEEKKESLKDIKQDAPISLWPGEALEYVNEVTGYKPPGQKKIKRIREAYTQTGSQIIDELRGITTTERIK